MSKKLLAAVVGGLLVASQAYAGGGAYNAEPSDSYNALAAGAVDLSGATLSKSQLSQSVSGVQVGTPTGSLAAGGISTGPIQGSTLSNANGILVQSTNTGFAANLGVASTVAVGSIGTP